MKRTIYILLALIGLSSIGFGQISNSKVEIYLLKEFVQPDRNSSKFWVDKDDLKNTPIIHNNEILGYDTLTYEISVDTSVCKKLRVLKPCLPNGIQFALTLDKNPILTGYFWNPASSFGCDWYLIQNVCAEELKIYKGGPEHLNQNIHELRNDKNLIQAIIQTNRLMNLDYSKVVCSMPSITEQKLDYIINGISINNIELVRIDTSLIENIEILKDESKVNINENQSATVKIMVNKEIFKDIELRDFIDTLVLNNDNVKYSIDNMTISKQDLLTLGVSVFRKIEFNLDNNKVNLIRNKNK